MISTLYTEANPLFAKRGTSVSRRVVGRCKGDASIKREHIMKISDLTGTLQQVEEKEAKPSAPKESTDAARGQGGDQVELSTALEQQSTVQLEQLQAQRIASIKSQLQAGSYRVDSRLVAQKMLSGNSGV